MCLILIAHQLNNSYRYWCWPTETSFTHGQPWQQDWEESTGMIAGRDLVSGGTWFGARNDRWATVTNIREGVKTKTIITAGHEVGWCGTICGEFAAMPTF